MSRAAKSILTWGFLMLVFGACTLFAPNFFLPLFGFPQTSEVWIRVVGLLIAILGGYYWYCARQNDLAFFRATVPGRLLFAFGLAAFVSLGFSNSPLLILAAIDTFGALWTWFSFRNLEVN